MLAWLLAVVLVPAQILVASQLKPEASAGVVCSGKPGSAALKRCSRRLRAGAEASPPALVHPRVHAGHRDPCGPPLPNLAGCREAEQASGYGGTSSTTTVTTSGSKVKPEQGPP
ncbi:MAG: hypothetical protein ACRDMH_04470 [Solirubrobacterales bacterium]